MPDVHVVPSGNLWACEIDGHTRSTHETQEEAIKEGRDLAEDQNGELSFTARTARSARRTPTGTTRATSPGSGPLPQRPGSSSASRSQRASCARQPAAWVGSAPPQGSPPGTCRADPRSGQRARLLILEPAGSSDGDGSRLKRPPGQLDAQTEAAVADARGVSGLLALEQGFSGVTGLLGHLVRPAGYSKGVRKSGCLYGGSSASRPPALARSGPSDAYGGAPAAGRLSRR